MQRVDPEPHPGSEGATNGSAHLRLGAYVLGALIALTIAEYVIALVMTEKNVPVMVVMNVIDAGLIMYYFMHITRAFREGH